jgi:aryl sulfotransferase
VDPLTLAGVALGTGALGAGGALGWTAQQFRWLAARTDGDAYFALPLAERRRLKEAVRRRARGVVPVVRAVSAIYNPGMRSFEFGGVSGPAMTCSKERFATTAAYRPQRGDVFVATQMKCGTTWMQQIVYEVLSRGRGDLGDAGHRHMYATSPWIESRHSVSMEDAPRIGEHGARIVKTHMPTALCPYGEDARYVYVLRDPVACFASCVDFLSGVAGPFAPRPEGFIDWFCGDSMWWGTWAEHADGWWRWAEERPNVLFLHYEDMLDNLGAAVDQVAALLEVDLSPEERAVVVAKSEFDFMKANEEVFEMAAPGFFGGADHTYFVSGKRERGRDVGAAARGEILSAMRSRLSGCYPASQFYPGLA